MRRGSIFWGGILIILGGLFLLQAQGLIKDVMGWFWPLLLILMGVWILASRFLPALMGAETGEAFSIDLQGAAKVALDFDHGAGSVQVTGDAPAGTAIAGTKGSGMEVESHLSGDTLTIDIDAGPSFIPFLGPDGGTWRFQLTREVPVEMKVDAGASSLDFDFTDTKLTFIGVDTGASSLKMKLPANAGRTLVDVESGAATIDITVPFGVGARIRCEQGISTQNIDTVRFPMISGGLYQSSDFDTAANKAEINLEGGANTVNIR
jgi:hypothetical protein